MAYTYEEKNEFRNKLIVNSTPAEEKLLLILMSDSRLKDKFKFQEILCGYIVDFYFPASKLIVEIDGSVHKKTHNKDSKRTVNLYQNGYTVIRFTNDTVYKHPEIIINAITSNKFTNSSKRVPLKEIISKYGVNPNTLVKRAKKIKQQFNKDRASRKRRAMGYVESVKRNALQRVRDNVKLALANS